MLIISYPPAEPQTYYLLFFVFLFSLFGAAVFWQVRLIPNTHEVILFGRHIFMGYLGDPEATAAAIDDRGFLHSGDIGNSDRAGFLYITGRLDNLIVTAGGEHIPAEAIEARVREHMPIVSRAVLVGDKRKFLAVLLTLKVVLDEHALPTNRLAPEVLEILKELGSTATTVEECMQDRTQKVRTYIERSIDKLNTKSPSDHHRVVRWELLPSDLSPVTQELTPTLKVNRKLVLAKNQELIGRIYGNEKVDDYTEAEWFHGGISRQDTETLRKRDGGAQDGWFLIRKSTKEKNTFVITLCSKGKLFHNQVRS